MINIVLLGLLILFFGAQQRPRARLAYRFWFAGWVLIFLSYVVWETGQRGVDMVGLPEAIRLDTLLLGGLAFLFSFVAQKGQLRRVLSYMFSLWVAICVGLNLEFVVAPPFWALLALILLGESLAVAAVWELLPPRLYRQRLPLTVLSVLFGIGLALTAYYHGTHYLETLIEMQVFESVAILYAGASTSGVLVRTAGFIGFAAWALMYVMGAILQTRPEILNVLYTFWDIPKYMVAFAMTLEIFEEQRLETVDLAEGYKTLYEDFYVLFDTHPHPMWICDAETGQFLAANRATTRTYGYSEEELLQMTVADLEAPRPDGAEVESVAAAAPHGGLLTGQNRKSNGAARRVHRQSDGTLFSVELTEGRILFQGEVARVTLAMDVTERDKQDQELFHLAHHDGLTGLPNRQLLEDRVMQCLARSQREGRRAVLLTIDVDHFKQVNDTYGHLAGDECLKAVAARLQSKIRQVDTLARTGGEEFTAIICGLSAPEDAEKIANALLHAFDLPLQLPDCALELTVSIGAALYPDDGEDYPTLRRRSDEALYLAKRRGRNLAAFATKAA